MDKLLNPILLHCLDKGIYMSDCWDILSALRGPDGDDADDHKGIYTVCIRGWACENENIMIPAVIGRRPTKTQIYEKYSILEKALPPIHQRDFGRDHSLMHLVCAYRAIVLLEAERPSHIPSCYRKEDASGA